MTQAAVDLDKARTEDAEARDLDDSDLVQTQQVAAAAMEQELVGLSGLLASYWTENGVVSGLVISMAFPAALTKLEPHECWDTGEASALETVYVSALVV
eukprot:SAG22_NODE_15741_length_342_cov_0.510288_1_plen_98_part_01